jgi:hypothetical protein
MRKEAGGGQESKEPKGGQERESGAEVWSVGQIVQHRRLGYRAVVVGSTKVTTSLSNHTLSFSHSFSFSHSLSFSDCLYAHTVAWLSAAASKAHTHSHTFSLSRTHWGVMPRLSLDEDT